MWFELSPEWLTAVGTISAVIVALGLALMQGLISWFRRPILTIDFKQVEPFCRYTTYSQGEEVIIKGIKYWKFEKQQNLGENQDSYWIRLKVKNKGRSMARDCEGKIARILDYDTLIERTDFDPVNLRWVRAEIIKQININRNTYEYLDLLLVDRNHPDTIFLETTENESRGIQLFFPKGNYIVEVIVFASNCKPVFKKYFIKSGKISYDEIEIEEFKRKL